MEFNLSEEQNLLIDTTKSFVKAELLQHEELLEKTKNQDLKNVLSKIKEGDIVEGKVKAILDWGAFIDLNGVDALLHITDISWSRISRPSELLSIGQSIKVKITKIEQDNNCLLYTSDAADE